MGIARERLRRWGPEAALALLSVAVFLGFLGSVELWGKREQRSAAEAIDTIREGHWLIAEIQSRPRLEKPPLPRWIMASVMAITGRRDEAIVRLPSALCALGMVGLVYALGRRIGGREVGTASGLALISTLFFVGELRQAGNDGPLAFFSALALYAAYRRLEIGSSPRWIWLFYAATGLGFLTKGPIVLLIVGLTVLPYLATTRTIKAGIDRLFDVWGLIVFLVLAVCWPMAVLSIDPRAWDVWMLEMAQKTMTAGIYQSRRRLPLIVDWPWIVAPWGFMAGLGLAAPFLKRGREFRSAAWFPWFWAAMNLLMFCVWKVAKPSYYLPCLPPTAILIGLEWVRICRKARAAECVTARRILQAHWATWFVASLVAPAIAYYAAPELFGWVGLGSASAAVAAIVGPIAWRRGADAGAMLPIVAASTVIVLIGYGAIAPSSNPLHGHRDLARTIENVVPPECATLPFFIELDEGLWFYLTDRRLIPVPGTQPRYNKGYDLVDDFKNERLIVDPEARLDVEKRRLIDWIERRGEEFPYLLIRNKFYERFAAEIAPLVEPIVVENDLNRNEIVLLKIKPRSTEVPAVASQAR